MTLKNQSFDASSAGSSPRTSFSPRSAALRLPCLRDMLAKCVMCFCHTWDEVPFSIFHTCILGRFFPPLILFFCERGEDNNKYQIWNKFQRCCAMNKMINKTNTGEENRTNKRCRNETIYKTRRPLGILGKCLHKSVRFFLSYIYLRPQIRRIHEVLVSAYAFHDLQCSSQISCSFLGHGQYKDLWHEIRE